MHPRKRHAARRLVHRHKAKNFFFQIRAYVRLFEWSKVKVMLPVHVAFKNIFDLVLGKGRNQSRPFFGVVYRKVEQAACVNGVVHEDYFWPPRRLQVALQVFDLRAAQSSVPCVQEKKVKRKFSARV